MAQQTKSATPCFVDQVFGFVTGSDFAQVLCPIIGIQGTGADGFSRNALVDGDQANHAAQFVVRQPNGTKQGNRTKKEASPCPVTESVSLVLGDGACADTASNPKEQQQQKTKDETHRPINAVLMVPAMDQLAHPQSGGKV